MDIKAFERVFVLLNQIKTTDKAGSQEISISKKLSTFDQITRYEVLQYLELKGSCRQQKILYNRIKHALGCTKVRAELVVKQ
jgi:hypothetical protein